ncbi:hypothetical protein [Hymenobacter arizonensis]|uniref:Uncharacterized protein n=1 Tax=Hymenobacter arizonensis TaxID=1227077 RepID=A0A1I6BNQ8_HYMAR|nr:hypothetical protein [Hymenobacter arizonensis]SFQ82578.1 hypothetical protein SAMN04515668_4840 [Hymenobacter arizonensis]
MAKYSVLLCVALSLLLLVTAAGLYPGGSLGAPRSDGFDWSQNFITNLFGARALNGAANPGRWWAVAGMAFHALGQGLFFRHMSRKMPTRHAAAVLQGVGGANLLFSFLVVTPLHDAMVHLSSAVALLGLFYVTVFVFRSRLRWFKFGCPVCLLLGYATLYLYGAGHWGALAIMQKVSLGSALLLVVGLEYFTHRDDFAPPHPGGPKTPATTR